MARCAYLVVLAGLALVVMRPMLAGLRGAAGPDVRGRPQPGGVVQRAAPHVAHRRAGPRRSADPHAALRAHPAGRREPVLRGSLLALVSAPRRQFPHAARPAPVGPIPQTRSGSRRCRTGHECRPSDQLFHPRSPHWLDERDYFGMNEGPDHVQQQTLAGFTSHRREPGRVCGIGPTGAGRAA